MVIVYILLCCDLYAIKNQYYNIKSNIIFFGNNNKVSFLKMSARFSIFFSPIRRFNQYINIKDNQL